MPWRSNEKPAELYGRFDRRIGLERLRFYLFIDYYYYYLFFLSFSLSFSLSLLFSLFFPLSQLRERNCSVVCLFFFSSKYRKRFRGRNRSHPSNFPLASELASKFSTQVSRLKTRISSDRPLFIRRIWRDRNFRSLRERFELPVGHCAEIDLIDTPRTGRGGATGQKRALSLRGR